MPFTDSDYCNGLSVQCSNAADDGIVVSDTSVTMKFHEIIKNGINIFRCWRTVTASGNLDSIPGCEIFLFLLLFLFAKSIERSGRCFLWKFSVTFSGIMQFQDQRKNIPHRASFNNSVEKSMFQKKFRSLEALRQFLTYSLFNDSRAGKSDQWAWLCKDNISKHGKACCNATGSRVCQHRCVEKPCLRVTFNGCGGFCHLHQWYDSFLHSGTAGATEQNDRKSLFCCFFKWAGDLFSHHISHGSHEKSGIHGSDHCTDSSDGGFSDENCLIKVCFFSQILNFLRIIRIV